MLTLYRYQFASDDLSDWIPASSVEEAWERAVLQEFIPRSVELSTFRQRLEQGASYPDDDDFEELYALEANTMTSNAAWGGCLFETYGREELYVQKLPEKRVWTVLDVEGLLWVVAGRRRVDRFGYLVTHTAWTNRDEMFLSCC